MIVVFDCETTGKDRARDQIIEVCVQLGLEEGAPTRTWRIKPSVAIHPEAQQVHGITAEMLAECPTFGMVVHEVLAVFEDAEVLAGYNIGFDIEMLQAELERCGRPMIDLTAKKLVDAFRLWQNREPRSLMDAHRRFAGGEFAAAHSAQADVAATARVLAGMLGHFGIANEDWASIAAKADPLPQRATWLGPTKHFQWNGDVVVFGFGKHSGAPIQNEPGFLEWMMRADFPEHVREICAIAIQLRDKVDAFYGWARSRYPYQKAA